MSLSLLTLTVPNHGLSVGSQVFVENVNGFNNELNNQAYEVVYVADANNFKILADVSFIYINGGNILVYTSLVSGIWHLEGETVTVVADGVPIGTQTVINGAITLPYPASVIQVGLPYVGLIRSMNLVPQSQAGSTVAKKKTVNRLGVKFLNTLGASYGTNLYNMEEIPFGQPSDLMGRTSPPYSGMKVVPLEDSISEDKHVYIQQTLPLPCTVEALVPYTDVDDE